MLSESERSPEEIKTELIPKEETGEGTPETLELQEPARPVPVDPSSSVEPLPAPAPAGASAPDTASTLEPTPESTPVPDPAPVSAPVQPPGPVMPVSPMPPAGLLNPPEPVDPVGPAVDPVEVPTGAMSAVELGSLATGPMPLPEDLDFEQNDYEEHDPSHPRPGFMPPELLARRRPAPHSAAYGLPQLQAPPLPQTQVPPAEVSRSAPIGATSTTGSRAPITATGSAPIEAPASRSNMTALLAGLAVLVLVVVLSVVWLHRPKDNNTSATTAPKPTSTVTAPVTVKLADVSGVDFTGAGSFDKRNGAWVSNHYNTAAFGNLKKGIGLVLDLGSEKDLVSVSFSTASDSFTAEMHSSDSAITSSGKLSDTAKVGDAKSVSGSTAFDVSAGGKHRYWMIWVSQLGSSLRATIDDIKVTAKP